jgi:methionine synthase I (cobalamin-dependent)
MEQDQFEKMWDLEVEKARQMVDSWMAQGSEDLLIEKILEQEEVRESVRLATQTAVESLAKLQVLKAQILSEQPEQPQQ